ncbi:hypothetical protein [Acinetobacter indicus]|uniref:hypothetical protein n=1 Tax=Acinetobacter indicus TaxID=756892 RepID=UPI0012E287D8|nr:hypothetical protein [Acinetobacter indicus]
MSITNELLAHMSYTAAVQKNNLREQLDTELAEYLAKGGEIKHIPTGQSGEPDALFNNRLTKPKNAQKTMRAVMASAVSEAHKKRARQKEDQVTLAEIQALDQWCKERKGRGRDLCRELKMAHSFISQITSRVRPCSKERYEQIKLAMEAIEKQEQVAA